MDTASFERIKVKMQKNVTVRKCCFAQYAFFELALAKTLRRGEKRFEAGAQYELTVERAEDWLLLGWCEYVH